MDRSLSRKKGRYNLRGPPGSGSHNAPTNQPREPSPLGPARREVREVPSLPKLLTIYEDPRTPTRRRRRRFTDFLVGETPNPFLTASTPESLKLHRLHDISFEGSLVVPAPKLLFPDKGIKNEAQPTSANNFFQHAAPTPTTLPHPTSNSAPLTGHADDFASAFELRCPSKPTKSSTTTEIAVTPAPPESKEAKIIPSRSPMPDPTKRKGKRAFSSKIPIRARGIGGVTQEGDGALTPTLAKGPAWLQPPGQPSASTPPRTPVTQPRHQYRTPPRLRKKARGRQEAES